MAKRGDQNAELRAKLLPYLRRTASLPDAQALAKRDGIRAPFSVWLGAAATLLEDRRA